MMIAKINQRCNLFISLYQFTQAMDADGGGEGEAKPDADPQPAEPQVEDVQPMDQ